ncbi:hypothetical protein HDU76_007323, partial [Blyttiomyces sp. JEL0837]
MSASSLPLPAPPTDTNDLPQHHHHDPAATTAAPGSEQVRAAFILNPKAANNSSINTWNQIKPEVESLFPETNQYTLFQTEYSGHAKLLSKSAIEQGYNLIIAMGGDGTISQVVAGFVEADAINSNSGVAVGIIPCGTGGDFVRTFEIPKEAKAAMRVIKEFVEGGGSGASMVIDVGRANVTRIKKGEAVVVESNGVDENMEKYYFVNIASFGISGDIVKSVEASSYTKFTGTWTYWIHTTYKNLFHSNKRVELSFHNHHHDHHENDDDLKFHTTLIEDVTLMEVAQHGQAGLKRGDLANRLPHRVQIRECNKVIAKPVDSSINVHVELDGEFV